MAQDYIIDAPAIALTAAAPKSVLVATAASTQVFDVTYFAVGCDATATGLLKVEFLVGTVSGGTGTTTTAPNVARMNDAALGKAPLTVATSYSAEPTYTKYANNGNLTIMTRIIPLPATPLEIEYPLGREFVCPESNAFVVRLTSTTVSPNAYTSLGIEE